MFLYKIKLVFLIKTFAKAFCEILVNLAKLDPSSRNCMKREVEKPSWVYEFKVEFKITQQFDWLNFFRFSNSIRSRFS